MFVRTLLWSICSVQLLAVSADAVGLTVTHPATDVTLAAGDDYATQVLGDAWDMSNAEDVDTDESGNLNLQTIGSGMYSATSNSCSSGANFYPVFQGYGKQTVAISRGRLDPIATSRYRYLTIKILTTTAQQTRAVFLEDGDSYANQTFGSSFFKSTAASTWTIQSWDMQTESFTAPPNHAWTTYPLLQGLRFDPCTAGSANIQVDWIRLTAPPAADQEYNVTWSDSGTMTYTISAVDSSGTRYVFATNVSGTSYLADFSRLSPGDYTVEVKRADNITALSPGTVLINTPPQVNITSPSVRGEQSQSYALTTFGYQWGPMADKDFSLITNFKNVSYTNPVGSFSARPTNGDPQLVLNTTGRTIDANRYRSICFTQEIFGLRSIGDGSIARIFWGVTSANVAITTDIALSGGLHEVCLPDLADAAAVPLVSGPPWAGTFGFLRFDPDEFTPPPGCNTPQLCHDVRLDSIILSPFAQAAPSYTLRWSVIDPDYAAGGSVRILLDPDRTFGNGNEISVATVPFTQTSYMLTGGGAIPDGTYNVVLLTDDGTNTVAQYARGKLITHAGSDEIFRNGFELP
jgi:hypothetical protein